MKKILSFVLVLALGAALLMGCENTLPEAVNTQPQQESRERAESAQQAIVQTLSGGVLCVKVNPEIALHYDAEGKVVKLEGRNQEGTQLLENFADVTGKDTMQVLEELVAAIGKAGYFVEEVDGEAQKIVLELDPGSQVPHDGFLQDMAVHVKACVERKCWMPDAETTEVPEGGCPVCYDDDCNDGQWCDDYDDRAENLREAERRQNGTPCEVCADYDCDEGQWCDDYDDREENLREEERRQNGTPCEICGEYDCDDGQWCDDGPQYNHTGHSNDHNRNHG